MKNALGGFLLGGVGIYSLMNMNAKKEPNYTKVREDVANILNKEGYDDGSIGPVLVRLAWHASGTYDKESKTGGSNGSTMRFKEELGHGANAGLNLA